MEKNGSESSELFFLNRRDEKMRVLQEMSFRNRENMREERQKSKEMEALRKKELRKER